jgi:hypothetical protein
VFAVTTTFNCPFMGSFVMRGLLRTAAVGTVVGTGMFISMIALRAADQSSTNNTGAATPIDLFAGMQTGDLKVKLIPKNSEEATVQIQNTTNQPLSVKLPDAFVGVPVLAQNAGGGGGGGRRNNNNSNKNQSSGGGFGGGGGGGFGGGGGGFNLPPEASEKLKVNTVCLEHGKEDPKPNIPYEIRPVDSYTDDANVKEVLMMLGSGSIDQRAAQAAAWHFANNMSWQEIAALKTHHLSKADEPYFTAAELQAAMQIASQAQQLAKNLPPADKSVKQAFVSPGVNSSAAEASDAVVGSAPKATN